jgi:septal ring factor EnvC (AmiA/AmiB activator)
MSDTPRTDAAWAEYLTGEGYSEDVMKLKKEMKQLERELAEAREQIKNLNVTITAALNSANASHFRAIEYQSQRDTLAEALKEIYNVSDFDWDTMPEEARRKYREVVLKMADDTLSIKKGGQYE